MKIKKAAEMAGGSQAVLSSINHIFAKSAGMRGLKSALKMNQKKGFDCPGCAWPDPDEERSSFEFCENGIKAIAEETTKEKADGQFFADHSIDSLRNQSDYWLGIQGRLTQPLYVKPGGSHYKPISWDAAFQKIADSVQNLESPDHAHFYTSGRASNEAAFLYQLLTRKVGTNNMPDCSNLCHESSGTALTESIGIGKGTVTLNDFTQCDLVLVIGQNPGTNHPRMLSTLQDVVRRGGKVISINPLFESGTKAFAHPQEPSGFFGKSTKIASHHFPVKINGDMALFFGIMKTLFEKRLSLDDEFIQASTTGIESLRDEVLRTPWQKIEELSGIAQNRIENLAKIIHESKTVISCWAMGLTQHANSVATIQALVNIHLLLGQIGKKGAGLCPVRGHSNVQGDRTMGITECPSEDFLNRLQDEFEFTPPRKHGHNVVTSIVDMNENSGRFFCALGGNFLAASPDTDFTAKALQNCSMTVSISTKLNRTHLYPGQESLILPCLVRSEQDIQSSGPQFVTVENSMGIVHSSQGRLKPISDQVRSEPAIICGMAEKILSESWQGYADNYQLIRQKIERVIPGFKDFENRVTGKMPFYLTNSVRDQRSFNTPTKKAHFITTSLSSVETTSEELVLMTIRSHDQFNTTIYGLDDRYRGIYQGRNVLLMNGKDMSRANIKSGDFVSINSHYDDQTRTVRNFKAIPYDIPEGNVAAYFPEVNPIVPVQQFADKSHTPISKSVIVKVVPES